MPASVLLVDSAGCIWRASRSVSETTAHSRLPDRLTLAEAVAKLGVPNRIQTEMLGAFNDLASGQIAAASSTYVDAAGVAWEWQLATTIPHTSESLFVLRIGAGKPHGEENARGEKSKLLRKSGGGRIAPLAPQEQLNAGVAAAIEKERQRIARELHDDIGQWLALLTGDVEWLKAQLETLASCNPALLPILDRFTLLNRLLSGAKGALRKTLVGLSPPLLDALGFAEAAHALATRFSQHVGIRCTCESKVLVRLPREAEVAAFRILQECLTNVARHAGATRVDIVVETSKGELRMSISDNGRGLQPVTRVNGAAGSGIQGMRDRASELGGTVEIRRRSPRGTSVVVRIPLRPA